MPTFHTNRSKAFRNEPYSMQYCRVWMSDSNASTPHNRSDSGVGSNVASAGAAAAIFNQQPDSCEEGSLLHAVVGSGIPASAAAAATTSAALALHHHAAAERRDTSSRSSVVVMTPKDTSSSSDDDVVAAGDAPPTSPPRAPARTMQHLLQNVPYLFLDAVADSTSKCHAHQHRVGENISAWSGRVLPDASTVIRDVFVAQLPFDLPLSALQDLADLLIDGPAVEIFHAAPHVRKGKTYDGCAFVKMSEGDAHRFIQAMHKRVLFDVDGVWVATAEKEVRELTQYCAWFQEQRPEQRREILKMPTPFSAMTAEFALRGASRPNTGNYYAPPVHNGQQPPSSSYTAQHQYQNHHHHQSQPYEASASTFYGGGAGHQAYRAHRDHNSNRYSAPTYATNDYGF